MEQDTLVHLAQRAGTSIIGQLPLTIGYSVSTDNLGCTENGHPIVDYQISKICFAFAL